ncbi:MAG: type II toxin-antitoxin system HipA family toxin [Thiobacillus sp.]
MSELWVWMNGELVGRWYRGRTGHHRFIYDESWLSSSRTRPLSLSMPISADRTVEGVTVGNFFDNLLPDSETIRKRVATRFKTNSTESFDLLQAIGRDCVGAVQILPAGVHPEGFDRLDYEVLSSADVEHILQNIPTDHVLGARGDEDAEFRLSIAGAQEKTALLRLGEQWCRPKGATPTTHILKLPLGLVGGQKLDLSHSVENEWLCGRILREWGFTVAHSEIVEFGTQKALAVERFDREFAGNGTWIARLPQEDFCQVLGVAPGHKYEVDGGPGMTDILGVLAGSQVPIEDTVTFLSAQLAFWLLAAIDGHAKNFSIFLLPGGRYRVTPLYDVLSAWPVIGPDAGKIPWQKARLAMAVHSKNAHYKLGEIQPHHWQQITIRSRARDAWPAMVNMAGSAVEATERALKDLPPGFPAQTADAILSGVRKQQTTFLRALDVAPPQRDH